LLWARRRESLPIDHDRLASNPDDPR
jgi:hypothetical protein